ncbi:hypothetical protein [uncultured Desulfobacter sp.]|uniref:hypothetical protein n=1 Tax=uncultured Desulfobacter sp. TaxID=240139 RepID=UPI002D1E47C2|nr:hypothetical protein [uncultured Desulfobacter sp.]
MQINAVHRKPRRKTMNKEIQQSVQSSDIIEKSILSASLNQNAWANLSQSLDLFFKSLKLGRVRGVVDIIIDTPDHRHRDDSEYIQLIRELIQHDLLITISGFKTVENGPLGMIDPDLFQYAEDGLSEFCGFIGVQPVLHIGRIDEPEIVDFYNEVAQRADVKILDLPMAKVVPDASQEQTGRLGNIFTMEKSPTYTADLINAQIHEKRLALNWCDRCSGAFSPFS